MLAIREAIVGCDKAAEAVEYHALVLANPITIRRGESGWIHEVPQSSRSRTRHSPYCLARSAAKTMDFATSTNVDIGANLE